MQKLEKISPSRSSEVNSPVISPSACVGQAQLLGGQFAGAGLEFAFGPLQAFARAPRRASR